MPDYSRQGQNQQVSDQFDAVVAVTPNDDADLADGVASALWVGTGGNVAITCIRLKDQVRTTAVFSNVSSGRIIPGRIIRVLAENTTASDIVALY